MVVRMMLLPICLGELHEAVTRPTLERVHDGLDKPRRPHWRHTAVGATTNLRHLTLQPLQVSQVGQICANGCGFIARVPQRTLTEMHLKQTSLLSVSLPQRRIPERRGAAHSTSAWSHVEPRSPPQTAAAPTGMPPWMFHPMGWVAHASRRWQAHEATSCEQTNPLITINEITLVRGESAQAERFSGRAKWMWSIGAEPCHGPRAGWWTTNNRGNSPQEASKADHGRDLGSLSGGKCQAQQPPYPETPIA